MDVLDTNTDDDIVSKMRNLAEVGISILDCPLEVLVYLDVYIWRQTGIRNDYSRVNTNQYMTFLIQYDIDAIPETGCKKLKKFFAGKSLSSMTDNELIKEFKHYQKMRLTTGPYFGQRYEMMNEEMLKQFIKGKNE